MFFKAARVSFCCLSWVDKLVKVLKRSPTTAHNATAWFCSVLYFTVLYILWNGIGGCGQRKLSIVPIDTEGYFGRQLCAVTNNGKNLLFLVPLQEELDTDTLPYDSAEFARMPQVPCLTCNATMPLQMLALHAENCQQTVNVSVNI